ncbi:hypothetical protein BASA81_006435 [Batrachochytrium salamandrivorans]|nr:hypothetical protein BASA81_006435 [Batrachochytrium salamandrivorans]
MSLPTSQLLHAGGECKFDFVDQSTLVSCGSEGSLRVVGMSPLEDSGFCVLDSPGFQLTSVLARTGSVGQLLLAKSDGGFDGCVELVRLSQDYYSAEVATKLVKFGMEMHDMCVIGRNGTWLACCARTEPLKVLEIDSPITTVQELKNHQGSVLGMCGSAVEDKLCVIAEDGSLTVWEWNEKEWKVSFSHRNYCQRSIPEGELLYKPMFHPTKRGWLVIPGQTEMAVLVDGKQDHSFEKVDLPSLIKHCCFTPNRVVAACDTRLVIWSLHTKRVESQFDLEHAPSSLGALTDEAVFVLDVAGQLICFTLKPVAAAVAIKPAVVVAAVTAPEFDEDDEDDGNNNSKPVIINENDGEDREMSLEKMKQQFASKSQDGEDDGSGNGGMISHKQFQREIQLALEQYDLDRREREDADKLAASIVRFIQPGSTRFNLDAEDPDRRFLCWNGFGLIFARQEARTHTGGEEDDGQFQSIEIEFAESNQFRPIRFKDLTMCDRAAMSDTGALFSSKNGSVSFRSFNPDLFANWKHQLDPSEVVSGVACGSGFSAVCTQQGWLRVFRPSGLQEPVVLLESSKVKTMVASSNDLLLVVYRQAGEEEGGSRYQVFDMRGGRVQVQSSGEMSCDASTILWAGFGDDTFGNLPVVFLKNGTLLALQHGLWHVLSVVSQDRQLSTRRLWPISLSKAGGGLLCVALRGERRQPVVVPRSTPQIFPIKFPLLGVSKTVENRNSFDYEQQSLLDLFASGEDGDEQAELLFDVMQLKAMLVAVRSAQLPRAFGLVERMKQTKTIELALQKALEAGCGADFAERVEQLKVQRELSTETEQGETMEDNGAAVVTSKRQKVVREEEEEEEDDMEEEEVAVSVPSKPPTPSKPVNNKFLIGSSGALRRESPDKAAMPSSPVAQLNRQSSYTAHARDEDHKRKL